MTSVMKRNILALVGGLALVGFAAPTTFAQDGGKPGVEHKEKGGQKEHKDARKGNKQVKAAAAKIGEPAPAFSLTDTEGNAHSLADLKGKVVVLEWFNPDCPVVQMHHGKNTLIKDTQKKFASQDVVWLAINSGAAGQQGSGAEANQDARKEWSLAYPVLLDESGTAGKAYGAKTTPHMFVIDKTGTLVYAGAIDNGKGSKPGDINYVDKALTQVLAGETVETAETRSYGCAVKYGRNKQ